MGSFLRQSIGWEAAMRNIQKLSPPDVLAENKASWDAAVQADPANCNKNRYRHPDIKARLLEETACKCAYCESKIGHNCPGDIEHKAPKSKRLDLLFDWQNMTIACTECNRRKLVYYEPACMFLDPNADDVESMILHVGPFVFSASVNPRAEITVRLLKLDSMEGRRELIARKLERLEDIKNLIERITTETSAPLKEVLLDSLKEHCATSSEFSGMVKTFVDHTLPEGWANETTQSNEE